MKLRHYFRYLFLLISILTFSQSNAQTSWCRPGAVWTYERGRGMGGYGTVEMKYTGDTLIDGILCNKLLTTSYIDGGTVIVNGYFYVYQNNNKVYVRRNLALTYPGPDTSFHVLYDFNMAPGDSISLVPYPDAAALQNFGAPIDFEVITTVTNTVNGEVLNGYYVRPLSVFTLWSGVIYDRIGSTVSFLPQYQLSDLSYIFQLLCYTDSSGWSYSSSPGSCGVLNINDTKIDFTVFPNPATDHVTLDLKNISGKKDVAVYSTDKSLLYKNTTTDSQLQIDCKEWSAGCYFVQISNASQNLFTKLIIAR